MTRLGVEPFIITCASWPASGRTWTRDTSKGAIALANHITRQTGESAVVTYTESGEVLFTSSKETADAEER